jgi:hypothetical protein
MNGAKVNIEEPINEITRIHRRIGDINDNIMSKTKDLRMALLYLKIESARLGKNNGINVIADNLEKAIDSIHEELEIMIKEDRPKLQDNWDKITEFIDKIF